MGLFSRETKEEKFWKWFAANAARLRSVPADAALIDEICHHLEKVEPGLTCELSTDAVEGPRELIISADGIRERIPAVQRLVSAAPAIPGWKVIAFRQPRPDLELMMFGKSFGLDALKFRPIEEGGKIGVEIYLPGYQEGDQQATGVAFLMLDSALGEYRVMTQVGSVTLAPLVDGAESPGLLYMSKMVEYFDRASRGVR